MSFSVIQKENKNSDVWYKGPAEMRDSGSNTLFLRSKTAEKNAVYLA